MEPQWAPGDASVSPCSLWLKIDNQEKIKEVSMKKQDDDQNKAELESCEEPGPDDTRRDFIKRFGAYSAGAAAGLFILMSPRSSHALGSDGGPR